MIQFPWVAASLPRKLRAMVVMDRPQRAHYGEISGARPDVLEPIAHHQPGLHITAIASLERHDDLALPVARIPANDIAVSILQHSFIRRILDGLARLFVQLGLYVE